MSLEEIKEIARKIDLDLEKYICFTKIEISVLKLDYNLKSFSLITGNLNDMKIISNYYYKTRQFDNQTILAGYFNMKLINEKLNDDDEKLSSDVLFFSDKLLQSEKEKIELIIIHELCHLLDLSDYYKCLNIQFSDEDEKIGNKIKQYAYNISDEWHGYTFGKLISYYVEKAHKENKIDMIQESMKPCFGDDFTLNLN